MLEYSIARSTNVSLATEGVISYQAPRWGSSAPSSPIAPCAPSGINVWYSAARLFWLTATPPLPDSAQPAAQAKGRERYEGFVEALGRRLAKGQTLAQEISEDVIPKGGTADRTDSSP